MNFNFHNDSIRGILRNLGQAKTDISDIETFLAFAKLANGIFREMNSDLAKQGASQGRVIVLSLLSRNAPHDMTPSELAQLADVTRGTMTGLIDGLERDGLIERVAHKGDRRMVTVRLKEHGQAFLDDIIPYYTNLIEKLLSDFTEEDHEMMRRLLFKMKIGFDQLWQTPECRGLAKEEKPED
ncbi:MarR family transcriptional regulator [Paenibacillus sp. P96]|uniref:MarR family transcriptional regulator n=1 Tax=Paenibacillus zeirhizosphaerae TaxID=2987519 RepID=A0ABT9FN88_9BACL|nr:MarR family transcriptional regulator [Paenibacillus sp. P96]MDP4096203.1 MarR family transcriptional regulator [Paenibacillus sp. P96]